MDVPKTLDHESIEEQDLVSRYVGQKLSPEEAEAFEEHYFGCDQCWAEVQAATEVRAAFSEERAAELQHPARTTERRVIRGPWFSWGLIAAAAAFSAIAIGTVLYLARGSRDAEKALAQALGNELPVEVRIGGRLSSLRPPAVVRGTSALKNASGRLRAVAGRAFEAVEEKSSPARLHSAGLAHLFLGEWDLAISSLEEASEATQDAQFLSDLAAVYWVRGRQSGNQGDFRSALQKAEEAIARNPRLPEAHFNKAMALEKIVPTTPAKIRKAWAAYLSLDTKSPWADIARDHLHRSGTIQPKPAAELWSQERETLDTAAAPCRTESLDQIIRRFPQHSRMYVEDDLLPAWGDAMMRGSVRESKRLLQIGTCIGSALYRVTGNAMPFEAILAIERAADTRQVHNVAAGHRTYRDGQRAYRQRLMSQALIHFQNSAALLDRAGSRFAVAAKVAEAAACFNQNNYREALRLLDNLRRGIQPAERYPALAARSLWVSGLAKHLLGYPAEALASLQAALRLYQRLGETENEAGIESLLAQAHEYLGDQERAWRHRDRALSLLTAFPSSPILGRVAGEAATAAISEGKTRTALFYLDYEIDFGMRESNEPLASDALHSRGLLYVALGDKVRGERDLLEARRLADRVADPSVRDRALAELGITQARLTSEAQGDSAIEALTNTLTFFRKTGNHHGTARTLFERALVNRRAGEIGAAKRDLTDAIAELEAVRGRLPQEDLRISYFAKGQRVFEELISILMTEGRGQEAFDVVEQARARALLDDLKPPSGQGGFRTANALRPLDAAAVVKALPKDLAILEYLVLEDRTLVWEVSREGVNLHIINIDALRLEDWVSDLRRALSSPGTAPLDSRSQVDLYTVLVGPAVKLLRQSRTIVLIPDKFLSAVPFAALRDPQDGLYMVEKYRLATSPSATLFLRSLARDSALASSSRRRSDITSGTPLNALIVGNPTLDGQAERLGDLPGAEEETKRVAALFRTSHILRGNEASKARFMELAPFHDVLHFAGHSILNADRAGHSSLVFAAAGSSEDGFLYAHELAAIRLSRARLVFLAACETAAGARAGGEGALSLARAFLASGVPAAIGSLWPVQDLPATELASRFYGHLLAGQDAAAALQSAQLELLRSGNASLSCPTAWAAFQLIGATTLRVSEKGASDG